VENSGKWRERKNKSERNESAKKNQLGAAQSQGKESHSLLAQSSNTSLAPVSLPGSCLIPIGRGSVAS
jgi:hypothetical protein